MNKLSDYIKAMVNLYGLVHKDDIVTLYNRHSNENDESYSINKETLDSFIQDGKAFLNQKRIFVKDDYLVSLTIMALENFDEILEVKRGKPFYIPTREELLKYIDDDYFEVNEQYERLLEFARTLYIRKSKAEVLCKGIMNYCTSNKAFENMPYLLAEKRVNIKNEKKLQYFYSLILDLKNNTRLWDNNGYTDSEIGV